MRSDPIIPVAEVPVPGEFHGCHHGAVSGGVVAEQATDQQQYDQRQGRQQSARVPQRLEREFPQGQRPQARSQPLPDVYGRGVEGEDPVLLSLEELREGSLPHPQVGGVYERTYLRGEDEAIVSVEDTFTSVSCSRRERRARSVSTAATVSFTLRRLFGVLSSPTAALDIPEA